MPRVSMPRVSSAQCHVSVRLAWLCMHVAGNQTGVIPYNDGGAAAHYAKLRTQNAGGGGGGGGQRKAGVQRTTEGIMPGSSWSEAY